MESLARGNMELRKCGMYDALSGGILVEGSGNDDPLDEFGFESPSASS